MPAAAATSGDEINHFIDEASITREKEFMMKSLTDILGLIDKIKNTEVTLKTSNSVKDITNANNDLTNSHKKVEEAVTARTASEARLIEAEKQFQQTVRQNADAVASQSSSYTQNIKNLNDYKKALSDNAQYQKQAVKDVESGAISADEYRKRITDLTAAQLKYRQEISALNAQLKIQTQLQNTAPTSITEAKLQNKQLTTQRDLLPTTDTRGIAELNALIDRNNQLIDENSDKLAKQKINVGNYGPSVKAALSLVEQELIKINAQLAVTDKGSTQFQVLTEQANLLKSVSAGLDKPFESTRTELRALTEAAQKVGAQFGLTSEQYQKFSDEVGARKDQIADIQKSLNFKASDTKGLDSIVSSVQAVVGAYGAWQSISVLVGAEDEELQKQMVKLQAALTLVTSVQQLANQLQTESALIQGALALKTQFLATAQKIAAIAMGTTSAAMESQAASAGVAGAALTDLGTTEVTAGAAGEGIAAVSVEAAAGMEAEAVAAGSLATGLDTVVVSEGAVAAGASTMATAIAATGIGLIVIGLAVAVYKIVEAIKDWRKEAESIKKANEDLVQTMKDLTDATKEYESVRSLSSKQELKDLENIVAKRKAAGVSQGESLSLDMKVAEMNAKIAAEEAGRLGATKERIALAEKQTAEAANQLRIEQQFKQEYIDNTKLNNGDKDYDARIKGFNDQIKIYQDEYNYKKANLDLGLNAFTANEEAQAKIAELGTQQIKQSQDERRKYVLETAKTEADIITSSNQRVLDSEVSTLDDRLAALKSNLEQQKKVLRAENAAIQSDPDASRTDKAISAQQTAANIQKVEKDNEVAIAKMKEDFRIRDLDAETETQKALLNLNVATNDAIVENDAITEQARLEALIKSSTARKAVLDADLNKNLSTAGISDADIERIKQEGFFEIQNKKITDAELKKLVNDYNVGLLQITQDTNTKRIAITKDYYQQEVKEQEKAARAIQAKYDETDLSLSDRYTEDLVALNNSYKQGLISTENFQRQKQIIEEQYNQKSLRLQISKIQEQLDQARKEVDVEKQLQEELTQLKAKNTSAMTDDEKKAHDDRIKAVTDELKAVQDAVGKETALYKALNEVIKKLSDATVQSQQDTQSALTKSLESIRDQYNQIAGVMSGALNAQSIRKKNDLQAESDAIDANSKKEIDAINASVRSEQDKAAAIQIVNARVQSQKDQIALKNRKIDEDNAKAQKAFGIFQILINTAIAISKAIPDPFKVAFAAGIGAAELAVAIATPVPKFKYGKNSTYEGLGIVDDGGQAEPIYRAATKSIELGGIKDRLTYLDRNDIVFPSVNALLTHSRVPEFATVTTTNNNSVDFGPVIKAVKDISVTTQIVTEKGHAYRNMKLEKYNAWVKRNIL